MLYHHQMIVHQSIRASSTFISVEITEPGSSGALGASPPVLHWYAPIIIIIDSCHGQHSKATYMAFVFRGLHRSLLGKWYHPKDVAPPGSTLDVATGGMQTPTAWSPLKGTFCVDLEVPSKLFPVNLSMLILQPGMNQNSVKKKIK